MREFSCESEALHLRILWCYSVGKIPFGLHKGLLFNGIPEEQLKFEKIK